MSVIDMSPEPEYAQQAARRYCFHCRKVIGALPCIEWMGSDERGEEPPQVIIYLHPACALDLILRMARDIHEIECSGMGSKVALVPCRTVAQEAAYRSCQASRT